MSRFISIYINVGNARKSYIMKRRKYWLGELNSNIWFVFITFVYSSFGQFPCKLLLHIRWRTEIGPTPSWIEIGDKIVWLSHNCLTEMFYDLIQSSGSSKSCCVYYLAVIWKKKFSVQQDIYTTSIYDFVIDGKARACYRHAEKPILVFPCTQKRNKFGVGHFWTQQIC